MDWVPAPNLRIPDWSSTGERPEDLYAVSPNSSPGIYTPAENSTPQWNYFDKSFGKATVPSPLTSPSLAFPDPTYVTTPGMHTAAYLPWSHDGLQTGIVEHNYVPLSLVHNPLSAEIEDYGEETEGPMYPYSRTAASVKSETPSTALSTIKAAWSNSIVSRRSSMTSKGGRGERTKGRQGSLSHKRRESTGSTTMTKHQLRSTKPGHRINYAEKPDSSILEKTKGGARTSHNFVEKQYRTRLNGQFSTLLGSLPPEVVGGEDGSAREGGAERKVSKAEVLDLARKHIENLECDKQTLEGDRKKLLIQVQRLREAWVKLGGEVMP